MAIEFEIPNTYEPDPPLVAPGRDSPAVALSSPLPFKDYFDLFVSVGELTYLNTRKPLKRLKERGDGGQGTCRGQSRYHVAASGIRSTFAGGSFWG